MSAKLCIDAVVSALFQENAFIAWFDGASDCLVFDPGFDHSAIISRIREHGLTPAAILNTHGHGDHIAGNAALKAEWPEAPLVIGAKEAYKLTDPVANLSRTHGADLVSPEADSLVSEGDLYSAAGFDLEVYETPGHSIGHVVFVWKGSSPWIVFAGDVLFQGSIGRTDFPDGNFEDLADAIRQKLYVLPDDTIVLPGHGPATRIGDEKRQNAFVRGVES